MRRLNVLFRVQTGGDPRSIVLDGGLYAPTMREKGFDAVFEKLLWPLIRPVYYFAELVISHNNGRFMEIAERWGTDASNFPRYRLSAGTKIGDLE